MKKLLITVCLSGLLSVPSAVLGAEMAGPSLYGSFRTGLTFGDGDAKVFDIGSRWGITGSHEVSEGLTASYKFETKIDTANAESAGGIGHGHDQTLAESAGEFSSMANVDDATMYDNECTAGSPFVMNDDEEYEAVDKLTGDQIAGDDALAVTCGTLFAENKNNSGPGGRHSYIALSGGFGTVTLGQFWSASANHYGFAVDPAIWGGAVSGFGGASARNPNAVSYSSSAGDVSFQIDKVTGDAERIEFGASATLGPVGVGLGYFSTEDDSSFTGVAISAGAAGVNLTIGLGSKDDSDTSILKVGGSVGDSGLSYAVQVINGETDADDQNLVVVTNSLGSGASLIFEHLSPGVGNASSLFGLKVDF